MIGAAAEIALLKELVETPSFSGDETRVAQRLAEWMEVNGFQTSIDAAGNVIGEIGQGSGPTIILLGHIDTVASFLPVRIESQYLHGRGSVDAKGSMACFACAAARTADVPARIIVIGATDEEQHSRGAIFLRDKYQPEATIIGEPSGVDSVVIGYKGQIKGSFAASSQAGHSAGPETANALETAVAFWGALKAHCENNSPDDGVFSQMSPHLASISGGPEHARLLFDIRLPPKPEMEELIQMTTAWQHEGTIRFFDFAPASLHSKNAAPAKAMRLSIREAGLVPKIKVKTGTCDMNTLQSFWNAPMIAYGPGDSKLDHTMHECISLEEFTQSIDVLERALRHLVDDLALNKPETRPLEFAKFGT